MPDGREYSLEELAQLAAMRRRAEESRLAGEADRRARHGVTGALQPAGADATTAIARERAREALLAPSRVVERASQLSRLDQLEGAQPVVKPLPEPAPVVKPLPEDKPELVVSRGSTPRKEGDADPDVAQLLDVVRRMSPGDKAKLRDALKAK